MSRTSSFISASRFRLGGAGPASPPKNPRLRHSRHLELRPRDRLLNFCSFVKSFVQCRSTFRLSESGRQPIAKLRQSSRSRRIQNEIPRPFELICASAGRRAKWEVDGFAGGRRSQNILRQPTHSNGARDRELAINEYTDFERKRHGRDGYPTPQTDIAMTSGPRRTQ